MFVNIDPIDDGNFGAIAKTENDPAFDRATKILNGVRKRQFICPDAIAFWNFAIIGFILKFLIRRVPYRGFDILGKHGDATPKNWRKFVNPSPRQGEGLG